MDPWGRGRGGEKGKIEQGDQRDLAVRRAVGGSGEQGGGRRE
jgi:hypothetical protein